MTDKVFILKDASFDIAASVRHGEDGDPHLVTIMSPERDQFITMRVDDFRRMAEAIERMF